MERITSAEIEDMRARGYDRSIIAEAESWLEVCKRADELIEQIDQAFDGVKLDDGIGLRESNGIDDYAGPERLRELRELDEKTDWRKIPVDLLNYCEAAPSFLDGKGLRFHLPAFLIAELRGQFHGGFVDRLIYNSFSVANIANLLTQEQRQVIIACIRLFGSSNLREYDPQVIQDAILRFS